MSYMRHYQTVQSADSPHQTKASLVIFGAGRTGGVTARMSAPSSLMVGNREIIQTLFVFLVPYGEG